MIATELRVDSSGPIAESSRVMGIDVARGFALLGIFFVNAAFFGMPFGDMYDAGAPVSEGWASQAVYWFTGVFCTGKFFPLFSILFGAGLAIIYESSRQVGRSFGWIFLRRLVVLALFGISHIVLLWYGDILLLYAGLGVAMLLLGRASPKVLIVVAGIVFSIGIVTSLGFAALSSLGGAGMPAELAETSEATARAMPEADSRIEQFGKVLADWNPNEAFDSRLIQLEREIQTLGPFSNAMLLRMFVYLFSLVFYILVTVWVVLPCFCIGAALTKSGFFHNPQSVWRKRLMLVGFMLGLPLSVLVTYASSHADTFAWMAIYLVGSNISGPLLALAYLSAILTLVERHPQNKLASAVGQLGRMGLTGYLTESLLMSAVMSHWGLGWFGTTTWIQRAGLVIALYIAILIFANIWMRSFKYGPMEWIWRSLTYFKWQPLLRVEPHS